MAVVRLSLRIERLVLEGLEESEIDRARVAIEQALARRLRADPGALAEQVASGRVSLPGGRFHIGRHASPEAIGDLVAGQLLAGVSLGGRGGDC